MATFGMGGLAFDRLMQAFRVKDEAEFGLDSLPGRRHFGVVRRLPRQRPCLKTMREALLNMRPDRIRQQSDQRFGIPAFESSLCSRDDRTEVHSSRFQASVWCILALPVQAYHRLQKEAVGQALSLCVHGTHLTCLLEGCRDFSLGRGWSVGEDGVDVTRLQCFGRGLCDRTIHRIAMGLGRQRR